MAEESARPAPPISGRWKPGQSGNPAGRPKTKPFKEALQRIIEAAGPQELDRVAAALFARAQTGDVAAIREVGDRMDGKVPQSIGGSDELPPIQGFAWIDPKKE